MLANAAVAVGLMAVAFGVAATRRPRAAHAAWLVVLLKLVTPPLVVVPVLWLAVKPTAEPAPKPIPIEPVVPLPEATGGPCPDLVDDGPVIDPAPAHSESADVSPPVPAVLTEAPVPPEPINPWRIASVVWLAGVVGWCGLVSVRVFRFRRFVAGASPADGETIALARSVATRLGLRHVPAVAFVDGAVSPMLWAVVGRPRILLPRRLWSGFLPDHREAVLAHELAHLARGDHWMRRFELIVLAAYWWCPVAWVAVRQLRRAEEACCDARVLGAVPGRAAAYAEALVETIAFVTRPGWVPLASGGAARASDLQRRVTMILNSTGGPRATAWLAAAVILAGLAVLPLAPGFADEPKPARVIAASADEPPAPPALRARAEDNFRTWQLGLTEPQPVPAGPQALPRVPAAAADSAHLRDDLELLEAQMNVKQAHVRAAERGVKAADRTLALLKEASAKGAAAVGDLFHAEEAFDKAASELEIRKAELQEHAVRVTQAKRRLESGDRPASTTVPRREREWSSDRAAPATIRPDPVPRERGTEPVRPGSTPTPARNADPTVRPTREWLPPASSERNTAETRAAIEKQIKDMTDQYERTQKDIEKMQKQQADIKKMLDQLAEAQKKLAGDQPTPSRRVP
jgi:beta-lactamase regulating signal transducer with metallopeptidase domain